MSKGDNMYTRLEKAEHLKEANSITLFLISLFSILAYKAFV